MYSDFNNFSNMLLNSRKSKWLYYSGKKYGSIGGTPTVSHYVE